MVTGQRARRGQPAGQYSVSIYASVVSELKSFRHRAAATNACHHTRRGAGTRTHTALPSARGTRACAHPGMPAPSFRAVLGLVRRIRARVDSGQHGPGRPPRPPYYTRLCRPAGCSVLDAKGEGGGSAPGLTPPCQGSRQERRFRETGTARARGPSRQPRDARVPPPVPARVARAPASAPVR